MVRRRRRPPLPDTIRVPRRWRRGWRGPFLVGILLLAVAVGRSIPSASRVHQDPAPTGGDWERYHDRTFHVVHVVDGDTVDLDRPDGNRPTTRVRLWGVDTPEVAHGGDPDMYFGPEAKRFAENELLGRDVHVALSPARTRDRYGRLLAYLYRERGGPSFNERLIEEGLAYADSRFRHAYGASFKNAEQRARSAGAGLWAAVTPEQMPAWRQRSDHRRTARSP